MAAEVVAWAAVTQSVTWLQQALAAARNRKQQRFAHLIGDAGVLVAGVRRVDRRTHDLFIPMTVFSLDAWPKKRRAKWVEDVARYSQEDQVLPRMRASMESLPRALNDAKDPDIVEPATEIMRLAQTTCTGVLEPLHDREAMVREDPTWAGFSATALARSVVMEMPMFLNSEGDYIERIVRESASTYLSEVGQPMSEASSRMETQFGKLLATQSKTFPALPRPDWVWE